jgi:ribonuclease BN (tRNA processing enzyme)
MKLTILGSGTCIPTIKRNAPGYFLQIGKNNILIDAGSGTARQLVRAGIDYTEMNYMFFTHAHPDHISDLMSILQAIFVKCTLVKKDMSKKKIKFFGPSGFRKIFEKLRDVQFEKLKNIPTRVYELKNSSKSFNDFSVKSEEVIHAGKSIGLRFKHRNKIIAYSGDTEYCVGLLKLIKNADLAALECSYPDQYRDKIPGHLFPFSAGKAAKESNVKKLVLSHFYPICEKYDIKKQCQKVFKGPIILARDLMEIEV